MTTERRPRDRYPTTDGPLSLGECQEIADWLRHRSLWHVVRHWLKVRRVRLADWRYRLDPIRQSVNDYD